MEGVGGDEGYCYWVGEECAESSVSFREMYRVRETDLRTRWRSPWAESAIRSRPVTPAGHGYYNSLSVDKAPEQRAKRTEMLVVFALYDSNEVILGEGTVYAPQLSELGVFRVLVWGSDAILS